MLNLKGFELGYWDLGIFTLFLGIILTMYAVRNKYLGKEMISSTIYGYLIFSAVVFAFSTVGIVENILYYMSHPYLYVAILLSCSLVTFFLTCFAQYYLLFGIENDSVMNGILAVITVLAGLYAPILIVSMIHDFTITITPKIWILSDLLSAIFWLLTPVVLYYEKSNRKNRIS